MILTVLGLFGGVCWVGWLWRRLDHGWRARPTIAEQKRKAWR